MAGGFPLVEEGEPIEWDEMRHFSALSTSRAPRTSKLNIGKNTSTAYLFNIWAVVDWARDGKTGVCGALPRHEQSKLMYHEVVFRGGKGDGADHIIDKIIV